MFFSLFSIANFKYFIYNEIVRKIYIMVIFMKKINVALVGLGFGGAFAAIYKAHPFVNELTVFDLNGELCRRTASFIGGARIASSFEEILRDRSIDAVHLVTPIPYHADAAVRALSSGKHCACTVPMATSLEDIRRINDAVQRSGKEYMLMETTLYTYQFLYVKNMLESGELGKIQFLRGSHYQDMQGWPEYWEGLPPMWYGTHAISPMRMLAGADFARVSCLGSGSMSEKLQKKYGNPYPVESAHFIFENGLKGEATRSLFETAREYQEGMFVYGSKASFEWGFRDWDDPYITTLENLKDNVRGARAVVEVKQMPNFYQRLPKELWRFTVGENYDPLNPQDSLKKGSGGGHHGSHPHLVHEFVSSIVEGRKPAIDVKLASNITAACVCAHESAMRSGEFIDIPRIF